MITVVVDAEGAAGVGGSASDAAERETQWVQREEEADGGWTDEGPPGREETKTSCGAQNLWGKFLWSTQAVDEGSPGREDTKIPCWPQDQNLWGKILWSTE